MAIVPPMTPAQYFKVYDKTSLEAAQFHRRPKRVLRADKMCGAKWGLDIRCNVERRTKRTFPLEVGDPDENQYTGNSVVDLISDSATSEFISCTPGTRDNFSKKKLS